MDEAEWQVVETRWNTLLEYLDAIAACAPTAFLAAIIGATIIGSYWY